MGHAAARLRRQPDFTSNAANNGGLSANSLFNPYGVALDWQGSLYVADYLNSRLLVYDRPMPLLTVFVPLIQR